jgi:hypothetical protein
MKKIILFFSSFSLLASCTNSNSNAIIGNWQTISLQNPAMDKAIATELADIDTFGNNDAIARQAVNIDSFKQLRKQLLDVSIAEQKQALQEIHYQFTNKGIAYIYNNTAKDSAMYTIKDNILTLDGPALTGIGDIQVLYIKSITDAHLQLQMVEGLDTSLMDLEKMK